ncbi:putative cardiolipin synthase [Polymorphobacter multimanifer]|uniref:Phospholipase D n=1 Tax=Polymorphobacter multimanifer TaxID=1070431 RepID=A0A841LED0_9SPHN|nr:phospholipase D family protein [Polymorphobacter multimanifer]MBB6227512.1 putative cardiolipin synthase [Polymorphobacter multimanifer]
MVESLARQFGPMAAAHPGLSGVQMLKDGPMSLSLRLLLVRRARLSLDVQYYIWRGDRSGRLLLAELLAAADRGVHVRLLLDDFGCGVGDARLAALHAHPHIEVRLFNPLRLRWPRWINFLFDFPRLNRRMHNKCLVVDGVAAVLGGRNIGDEYFDGSNPALAADLDALAVGAIAADVAADFERYWHADAALPLDAVVTRPSPAAPLETEPRDSDPAAEALIDEAADFDWVAMRMLSDDPDKVLGRAGPTELMLPQLIAALAPTHRLLLVSPYFVPLDAGVALLAGFVGRGVQVTVLTNSLQSNNVAISHAGYAPARRALLRAGVRLWEMKGRGLGPAVLGLVPRSLRRNPGTASFFRASASALHAKTFIADGARLFVGSMNFDARSWQLNTEIGFLIESAMVAGRVEASVIAELPYHSWSVELAGDGLAWRGPSICHRTEPGTRWWQRGVMHFLGWLPIKRLL